MPFPEWPARAAAGFLIMGLGAMVHALNSAFDPEYEPNNSASIAESINPTGYARGSLHQHRDPIDVYTFTAPADGRLTAWLFEHGATTDRLSLDLRSSYGFIQTAGTEDGKAALRLVGSVAEGRPYFIVVKTWSGSGGYHLRTRLVPAPTLTGLSSSNPDPGESLTITGTDFGADKDLVSVWLGEVDAEVTQIADTSLTVTVPWRAVDGAVWIIRERHHSNSLSLTIGDGTPGPPAGFDYKAPDGDSLVRSGPGNFYFDRVLVSFSGSTTDTQGAAVLDAAAKGVRPLEGWSRVGLSPDTNTWQVELSWDPVATVADWEALAAMLQSNSSVDHVGAEVPVYMP